MAIVYVGIDLAKNVFAVHSVDEHGKPALVRPSVPRAKLHELIASLPPCTVAMEACSGAHHWARLFSGCGHTVRLIAPKFVAPYRMSGVRGKNDAADAAAICEAVQRPSMRFVPPKSADQQARLMVHRARQAPCPPGLHRSPHRLHQPAARVAVGAGHRAAAEGGDGASPGQCTSGRTSGLGQHGGRRSAE
jgi:transposase